MAAGRAAAGESPRKVRPPQDWAVGNADRGSLKGTSRESAAETIPPASAGKGETVE